MVSSDGTSKKSATGDGSKTTFWEEEVGRSGEEEFLIKKKSSFTNEQRTNTPEDPDRGRNVILDPMHSASFPVPRIVSSARGGGYRHVDRH